MVKLYVANTDNSWFDFLQSNGPFEEVNFWKPSQQLFRAIDEGGLFVFRLKSPRNVIGGYGMLVSSINVPIRLAWDSLGKANGVASQDELVRAIARYRELRSVTVDSLIGCRVLKDPIFFDKGDWFSVPDDWSQNIVTGKVYDSDTIEGARLLLNLEARTSTTLLFSRGEQEFQGFRETEQAAYGAPVLVEPRLGQGSFRLKVSDAYQYQCAISETRVLPALDAAHIVPYVISGDHSVANGILLRKDIHAVFDEGFATIDAEGKFRVSSKIREIFNNGHEYYRLNGKPICLPAIKHFQPAPDKLVWHREQKYVGD